MGAFAADYTTMEHNLSTPKCTEHYRSSMKR